MSPLFMTLLLLTGWGVFAVSAWKRWNLLRIGVAIKRWDRIGERIRDTLKFAFGQMRMPRYRLAGFAHAMIFFGFLVLLFRTLILWGRGYDEQFSLWILGSDQVLGQIYSVLKDMFALMVTLGAFIFLYYRQVKRLKRMTLGLEGLVILWIIIVMMISDILYDGAQIALDTGGAASFVFYEPAGSVLAMLFAGLPQNTLVFCKHLGFWMHSGLVLLFLNLLPYSKHFHIITVIPNIFLKQMEPPGKLPALEDLEGRIERGETLGIKRIDQFHWKAILDFYTCTECGRCSDHCPAHNTGKKLSPKQFTIDLRNFLYTHEKDLVKAHAKGKEKTNGSGEATLAPFQKDLVDGVIDPEVLWACTTCRACEVECPVFISYVDKIVDMRRYLVQERAEFPNELQKAFRSMETSYNPWGFSADDRTKWSEGLNIPTLSENPEAEVIFWIGCAPAYDERAKKVTRATAMLMQKAGVNFAIIGNEEKCTGDPARRAGNEYLFQILAQLNVETLKGAGAEKKKIIATCPHCFNTLANEYADFGAKLAVCHHTQFLMELVEKGKLKPTTSIKKTIAYHDSCYLGRYNQVYDPPREILKSIPGVTLVEPKETRDRGMCCGAGGSQMFKEEEPGKERVNLKRTEQLLETKADTLCSACPFCSNMLSDGLADKHKADKVAHQDVAQILLESVMPDMAKSSASCATDP